MKKILSVFLSLLMLLSLFSIMGISVSAQVPDTANIEHITDLETRNIDFNDNWQFYLVTRTPSAANADGTPFTGRRPANNFRDYGVADQGEYTTAQVISNSFDDNSWRTVSTPHDFGIESERNSGNDQQGGFYGGFAYYRKTFTIPTSYQEEGKRVIIDFEGVYQNSIVYLNGEELGNYPSGYTGFAYDLTDKLNYGDDSPNVIVVKIQNMSSSGRWYTGSGIVRPVTLVVTNPIRIVRNGVGLSTPTLEQTYKADGSANLNVSIDTYSNGGNGQVYLRTIVRDANGNVVADKTQAEAVSINPTSSVTLSDTVTVPNVQLWYTWDTGTPYLYTVTTELYYDRNNGDPAELYDTVETSYGFRWFNVENYDPDDASAGGFYLNDVYLKLKGVDLHHDLASLGGIDSYDGFDYRIGILKEMGVNSYRTSHCPPPKSFIEVCSERGILVNEEIYDSWGSAKATYDFGLFYNIDMPDDWAGYIANGMTQKPTPAINYSTTYDDVSYTAHYTWADWCVQEMVNRDYNEPSVVMWSVGNELWNAGSRPAWLDATMYDPLGVVTSPTYHSKYTQVVRLKADIQAIDTTRYVVYATASQRDNNGNVSDEEKYMNRTVDGMGLNYNQAISIDSLARLYPDTFWFQGESASYTSSRGVYIDPTLLNTGINYTPGSMGGSNYDNDFQSWTISSEYNLKVDRDRKFFAGQYVWTGFDYLGETTPYESIRQIPTSSFGIIDTAGFPKDSFYMYQSQWTDSPMVHIVPDNWNNWKEGEIVDVWIYTNAKTVELFLNDESLGVKSFDVKQTAFGDEYYETSEYVADDKTWGDSSNPSGYTSTGATVVSASGDSSIAEGSNFGRLHLTYKVPYTAGVLTAKAYSDETKETLVAEDVLATSDIPYTFELEATKNVIAADGTSLSYVQVTVVDENGNVVPNAENLIKFDVTGGAIAGVDNGAQEDTSLFKWGNVESNIHSERAAYMGKALVILQANKGETGTIKLTVSSEGMKPAKYSVAVTEDGTGVAPIQPTVDDGEIASVDDVEFTMPIGVVPTLPKLASVAYSNGTDSYTLNKPVVWNSFNAESFNSVGTKTIYGVVEGTSQQVKALIKVIDNVTKKDIAFNKDLGNNNYTFDFDALAADSSLRNGALATASYTGSSGNYPNNMLNGDETRTWTNAYSRGATILLPTVNQSKPSGYVEFYWDSVRAFDSVGLFFTVNETNAVPSALEAYYFDGSDWISCNNQTVALATETATESLISFSPVVSDRVRIYMTNATPYGETGNMTISKASVYGWAEQKVLAPESSIKNEAFDITVITEMPIENLIIKNESGMKITAKVKNIDPSGENVKTSVGLSVGTPGDARTFSVYDGEALIGDFSIRIEKLPSKIVSVETPDSVTAGVPFSFTAKTTKDLSKGLLYNEAGKVIKTTRLSRTIEGDYSTTVYESVIGTASETARSFTFKADFDKKIDFPYSTEFSILVNKA